MNLSDSATGEHDTDSFDLELQHATVAYHGNRNSEELQFALREVNLRIQPGEAVAIVGPNGSGKSTLGRVLAGLLPLSKGSLTVRPDIKDSPLPVQLIFQNPDAQIVGETPVEDVSFGLENFCCPPNELESRARRALTQVSLDGFGNHLVAHLSGGQKSLLCVASALAVDPRIFVFDEATAMLDSRSRTRILAAAQGIQQRGGSVLWITQWMEEAAEFSRLIALKAGHLCFDGNPRDFFYAPNSTAPSLCEELGLALPYAVQAANELARRGISLAHRPLTNEDLVQEVKLLCHSA